MDQELKKSYQIKSKKTLNEQVYDSLKHMIIDDVLKPNDKLNETDIANTLGVSATPVRESFRRLAAEGFVQIIPYKGVYVKDYSITELKEVYQCRETLELLAIELAFPHIQDSEIDDLIEGLESNVDSIDISFDLSNKIHDYIIEKADNKRLRILLDHLNDVVIRDRNISADDEYRRIEIFQEHMEILKSMKDRNIEKSKNNLSRHIKNGYKYIESKIKAKKN